MNKSYRVHQFAALAGVTVKALRHYDRIGLLRPRRSEAGYRLYQPEDLNCLQQIVALKSLGLPLKDIRTLLNRDPLPLVATFRQQRQVLEEKRRLLDRAIQALSDAEAALESGASSTTAVLQGVIRVMEMQDIDVMRKYYSDDAWDQWKHHYEGWPPEEWRSLYQDIVAAIGSDPSGPVAQALADRWRTLLDAETGGDEETRREMLDAWSRRHQWPDGMKRYFASLYELDVETWERVTDFLERAATIDMKHARRNDRPTASVE